MRIVDITAISVVVALILVMFVGSGGMSRWLHACAAAANYGWLLRESVAAIATAITIAALTSTLVQVAATGGYALLLNMDVDIGWGLLADGQAELMDACQLSLHCSQAYSLVLDKFLRGGVPYNASNALPSTVTIP